VLLEAVWRRGALTVAVADRTPVIAEQVWCQPAMRDRIGIRCSISSVPDADGCARLLDVRGRATHFVIIAAKKP
jgi:hypothetical protein